VSLIRTDAAPFGTLVLPVYNAEGFLEATLRDVYEWLSGREEPWELIVVDDASRDGSPRILDAFSRAHAGEAIQVLRFDANHGKGFAVRVGLDRASGGIAVFTDCDLAYPLVNIDRILTHIAAGADAAIACRVSPESTYLISPSFFSYLFTRHVMGRIFNAISRAIACAWMGFPSTWSCFAASSTAARASTKFPWRSVTTASRRPSASRWMPCAWRVISAASDGARCGGSTPSRVRRAA
jgi:glycosyltransferase involved in cell wall biosynthesis